MVISNEWFTTSSEMIATSEVLAHGTNSSLITLLKFLAFVLPKKL
jgi:hypothetical protein